MYYTISGTVQENAKKQQKQDRRGTKKIAMRLESSMKQLNVNIIIAINKFLKTRITSQAEYDRDVNAFHIRYHYS